MNLTWRFYTVNFPVNSWDDGKVSNSFQLFADPLLLKKQALLLLLCGGRWWYSQYNTQTLAVNEPLSTIQRKPRVNITNMRLKRRPETFSFVIYFFTHSVCMHDLKRINVKVYFLFTFPFSIVLYNKRCTYTLYRISFYMLP